MELSDFIQDLLTEGKVSIKGALTHFSEDDISETGKILERAYSQDILEMPGTAPAFSKEAATWAASRFYMAVQMAVLREIEEETIKEQLKPYEGTMTPEAIYSADLVLRHLPVLFNLVKGFAPADLLVEKLQKLSAQWPFSSVGIELVEIENEDIIFAHASLKPAYLDRIITQKDVSRIAGKNIPEHIKETTGGYGEILWPGLETALKIKHGISS
jgi:hypothetical protein